MQVNYPGIKLEPALGTRQNSTFAIICSRHVVHTTAKKVISSHRKNENVFKKCEKVKNAVQSVQKYCFSLSNVQICMVFVAAVLVVVA